MFKKGWQPENYKGVHDEIKQQHMKTKDMSAKGRFEYFWYYYKVHRSEEHTSELQSH